MAKKRTINETTDDQPSRRILKRASQACEICRNRKVRCDVTSVAEGSPCHNCKFAGTQCHVPESNRKRWQLKSTNNHPRPPKPASLPVTFPTYQPETRETLPSTHVPNGLQTPLPSMHVPDGLHQDSHACELDVGGFELNTDNFMERDLQASPQSAGSNVTLQGHIQELPSNMDPQDVTFLLEKGALALPSDRLRNALLTSYVEYVYPYAPTIDLLPFLDILNDRVGEHGKVSLLLLRSILFAGVAFVDFQYLAAAGFETRRQARKEFYKVCRLLHDFDYEKNRVTLIQSLLLLTHWYETADDPRDTWHWMGVVISLSHTIGLHKNPSESKMALGAQRLWKRIWWSCYMRDREIAIGMRRPIRIKESDYEVPMLTMEDFDFGVLSDENTTINQDCTIIRDVSMQKEAAALCISKAELSTLIILPTKNLDHEKVAIGGLRLSKWLQNLPNFCQYTTPTYESIANGRSCLAVHKALVHMIYYTALQVFMSIEHTMLGVSSEESQPKVREAAHANTRITNDLYLLNLDRFLPNAGISVILPALINHLLDIKSSSDPNRDAALRGFGQCLKVLERLRDNFAAADFAVKFCRTAIKQGNINLPVAGPEPSTALFPSLDQISSGPSGEFGEMDVMAGREYFDQQFNEDFGTFAFEEFFDIPIENGEWLNYSGMNE